jgi:copper chaperone CopZ
MVVLSSDEERATIQLAVTGMHCASCVDRIERFLGKSIGVKSATVNLATNTATITYDPMIASRDSLVATVVKSGYGASAIDDASNGRPIAKESDFEFPNLLMAIILTIPIIVVSMTRYCRFFCRKRVFYRRRVCIVARRFGNNGHSNRRRLVFRLRIQLLRAIMCFAAPLIFRNGCNHCDVDSDRPEDGATCPNIGGRIDAVAKQPFAFSCLKGP